MPTVETTITVSIPDNGATLGELEERVAQAVQEAGRTLLAEACQALEKAVAVRRRRVQQVKARPRDLLTRFGWLRLQRRQVVDRVQGRYTCPLDELLALAPRQHASPWVQEQAVALATRLPYRQAATLLSGW